MLYCGYSGVGKTTFVQKVDGIDLDSSSYEKKNNWEENYVKDAIKKGIDGKTVFISAHRKVVEYCLKNNIDFVLIIPNASKEEWVSRLIFRYFQNRTDGNFNAVKDCLDNFEEDMLYYNQIECKKIKVNAKEIQTDLEEKILKIIF